MSELPDNGEGENWQADKESPAWMKDRGTETAPLPYANTPYDNDPIRRQVDLDAAARKNIATAAGELGMTSEQYEDFRRKNKRSPTPRDVQG